MKCDLGTGSGGDRYSIDDEFKQAPLRPQCVCLACGQPAKYRLIAKNASVASEEVANRGYVCEYHLSVEPIYSPKDYGIREV